MAAKKKSHSPNQIDPIERIKRLVVIAMFSDNDLTQQFVLKGGNAIDLVLHAGTRASLDVDLSIEKDFPATELEGVRHRLENALQGVFTPAGFHVFDVTLEEKPPSISPEIANFWGGYSLTFKLIDLDRYRKSPADLHSMRRTAIRIGTKGKFEIDISKFEYCKSKKSASVDGHTVFVYTPEMLICEKLRAICQQMPEYGPIVKRNRPGSARARDFVDIQVLTERFSIEMTHPDNLNLLRSIFGIKRVPLRLLSTVINYRGFHEPDFQSVKDSVKPGVKLEVFDFYFGFVITLCERLSKALRDE